MHAAAIRQEAPAETRANLQIEGFFDPATSTISYIVLDRATRRSAIVDSVLDYDPKSGRTSHRERGPTDRARA